MHVQENIHNFSFVFIFLAVCYNSVTRKPHLPMAGYIGQHNNVLHNLVQQNIHFYQLRSYYFYPYYPTMEQDFDLNVTSQQILRANQELQISSAICRRGHALHSCKILQSTTTDLQKNRLCCLFEKRSQPHYLTLLTFHSCQSRLSTKIGFDSAI